VDEREGRLAPAVDLYWIPLGIGAHVARLSGKVYEAVKALVEHRPRLDLYHSALQIVLPEDRFVIECAAILNLRGEERGVVAEGSVGASWLGRFRLFRCEIRRWRGGSIPDLAYAVSGPVRVETDVVRARQVVDLVPHVPTPVWGRDELHTGEMWNSNSVIFLASRRGWHRGRPTATARRRPSSWLERRSRCGTAPDAIALLSSRSARRTEAVSRAP
jgi:hypothetical protein